MYTPEPLIFSSRSLHVTWLLECCSSHLMRLNPSTCLKSRSLFFFMMKATGPPNHKTMEVLDAMTCLYSPMRNDSFSSLGGIYGGRKSVRAKFWRSGEYIQICRQADSLGCMCVTGRRRVSARKARQEWITGLKNGSS